LTPPPDRPIKVEIDLTKNTVTIPNKSGKSNVYYGNKKIQDLYNEK